MLSIIQNRGAYYIWNNAASNTYQWTGITHEVPMTIQCDNQVVIYTFGSLMFYKGTKHIEVSYHFVRDLWCQRKFALTSSI